MNPVILVPLKEPARAKSRLAPILTGRERSLLARAMLEDLIQVLQPLPCPVVTITASPTIASRVASAGWRVLWEEHQVSESAAVDGASRLLVQEGVPALLRLPADLPWLEPGDVADLLDRTTRSPSAVLAPSHNRLGTNALLRIPPDLFPSHFGPDSFALHLAEAEQAQAHIAIVNNPRLALDIDDATDIARFLEQPTEGETYRLLLDLNIDERLKHYAGQIDPHPRA